MDPNIVANPFVDAFNLPAVAASLAVCMRAMYAPTVFYSILVSPIEFGFFTFPPRWLLICTIIAGFVLAFKSFEDMRRIWGNNVLTDSHRRALIFLGLDIVAAVVPFGIIAHYTHRLVLVLIWCRLARIRTILYWQDEMDEDLRTRVDLFHRLCAFRLCKIIALQMYWLHIFGCVAHFTASIDGGSTWLGLLKTTFGKTDFDGFWSLYSGSFYFAYICMSTVGFGDIHPTTVLEAWVLHFLLLVTQVILLICGHMTTNLVNKWLEHRRLERAERRAAEERRQVEGQALQEIRSAQMQLDLDRRVAVAEEARRVAVAEVARLESEVEAARGEADRRVAVAEAARGEAVAEVARLESEVEAAVQARGEAERARGEAVAVAGRLETELDRMRMQLQHEQRLREERDEMMVQLVDAEIEMQTLREEMQMQGDEMMFQIVATALSARLDAEAEIEGGDAGQVDD